MEPGTRGQSEVIGAALLLGITLLSIALIVSIAGSAHDSTRDTTDLEGAAHAMSQLDSRAALVALGRTESQSISMGRARDGSYSVDEEAGWISITHHNYTGGSTDHEVYNETLGIIEYEHGDRTIAYQGGGVWRTDGEDGSVLVSPPEFHYRGETLTIPVIRIRSPNGAGSASGDVMVELRRQQSSSAVYPNASASYPDISRTYRNPVQNGSISVTIHSDYYRAWGEYFRTRTSGNVSVVHSNQTATVELTVPGVQGDFDMPLEGDGLMLRGTGDRHSLTDLNVTISPDDSDSAGFSNLRWSLYAEDGSRKLELHIRGGGNPGCGDTVSGAVYYTDGTGTYQGWKNDTAFPVVCQDWDGDGDDEARVVANWTKPIDFEYTSLSNDDLQYYNPSGSLQDPVTFDEHDDTVGWEPVQYDAGDEASVNGTVGHYSGFFAPTMELKVHDFNGDSVNEDVSTGSVEVGGGEDTFVTYVHATENTINATLT